MAAPDYIDPVIGWRMWCTARDDEGMALRSVNRRTVWPRRAPLVAECVKGRMRLWPAKDAAHRAPGAHCRCGIYASQLELLRGYLGEWLAWGGFVPVIGTVALWGHVFEHDHGWRASKAYPQSLFVPVADTASDSALAAAHDLASYGVPVSLVGTHAIDDVLREASASRAVA